MARAATKERTESSIAAPSREDFAAMLEQSFETQSPQEGSVIKGTIVGIENDFAMVDVGLKTEGRISLKEFAMPGIPAVPMPGMPIPVRSIIIALDMTRTPSLDRPGLPVHT